MNSARASCGASSHKLAKTSLLLGVAALLGLGVFTGIPAIILGHRARRRARSDPAQSGGAGLALSGLALGYLSVVLWLGILSLVVVQQVARAKRIACTNHLHQLGSALTMWSLDHGNRYPYQVSTNAGGTLELVSRDADGFERNSAVHFQVLSNELNTPRVLLCPADSAKRAARDWPQLQAANVSYRLRSAEGVDETHPEEVLAVCPKHDHVLFCDGSVRDVARNRGPKGVGQ